MRADEVPDRSNEIRDADVLVIWRAAWDEHVAAAIDWRAVLASVSSSMWTISCIPSPLQEAPWHFYNCTRYGLPQWFEDLEIEALHVRPTSVPAIRSRGWRPIVNKHFATLPLPPMWMPSPPPRSGVSWRYGVVQKLRGGRIPFGLHSKDCHRGVRVCRAATGGLNSLQVLQAWGIRRD